MAYILCDTMKFDWDPEKDRANQTKHELSFEEASAVFEGNSDLLELYDVEHSDDEDRFIGIGNRILERPQNKKIPLLLYDSLHWLFHLDHIRRHACSCS